MSFIDLTDVLLDPEIAGQTFTVIRRREVVNEAGQGVPGTPPEVIANVVGQVTPTEDNSLVREVAFQTQQQTIQVITQYRLRGATAEPTTGNEFQPDLVLWHGDYFVVNMVGDFTPYGNGFIVAQCTSIDYREVPAFPKPGPVGKLDFSRGTDGKALI